MLILKDLADFHILQNRSNRSKSPVCVRIAYAETRRGPTLPTLAVRAVALRWFSPYRFKERHNHIQPWSMFSIDDFASPASGQYATDRVDAGSA